MKNKSSVINKQEKSDIIGKSESAKNNEEYRKYNARKFIIICEKI